MLFLLWDPRSQIRNPYFWVIVTIFWATSAIIFQCELAKKVFCTCSNKYNFQFCGTCAYEKDETINFSTFLIVLVPGWIKQTGSGTNRLGSATLLVLNLTASYTTVGPGRHSMVTHAVSLMLTCR